MYFSSDNVFLKLLVAGVFILSLGCANQNKDISEKPPQPSQIKVPQSSHYLIGSYTKTAEHGVYRLELDYQRGVLSAPVLVAATKNPSYLLWRASDNLMLTVNETGSGGVSSFKWDAQAAEFRLIASQQKLGDAPCFIAAAPAQDYFAVANYMSGNVQLFSSYGTGQFDLKNSVIHVGRGKHARQEAAHPHWINWSPNGKFIYAVDLGLDQVMRYELVNGELAKRQVAFAASAGDGPRHMVFHPQLNTAYLLNELSNTVVVLEVDESSGDLVAKQRLSSLDPGYSKHNQAAAIKMSDDGRFLYVSNRGANTIASFSVNELGALEYMEQVSVVGRWPRDFTISSDGRYVLVANSGSNSVNLLKRDATSGRLQITDMAVEVHQPTVVVEF